jgi:hypothetical protein
MLAGFGPFRSFPPRCTGAGDCAVIVSGYVSLLTDRQVMLIIMTAGFLIRFDIRVDPSISRIQFASSRRAE